MTTIRPPAADLPRVVGRMRALAAELDDGDGLAAFHRVYLSVTRELARGLCNGAAPGRVRTPAPVEVLAVVFAERYLAAVGHGVKGRRPAPACWRPLLERRHDRRILPVQFALAGINAHVGHDLALAVVDACAVLGCEPAALEGDFDRVGDVLVRLEERVREQLMPGPDVLEAADPLTHLAASWCLGRARSAAWGASKVLWGLRGTRELGEEFTQRLDATVGVVGRCLLSPLGSRSCTRRR